MKNHLRGNLLLFVFTVVICSVLYPTVMYALGRGLFPTGTSGGLINDRGESVREGGNGSHLIAQPFTSDEYFRPRRTTRPPPAAVTSERTIRNCATASPR